MLLCPYCEKGIFGPSVFIARISECDSIPRVSELWISTACTIIRPSMSFGTARTHVHCSHDWHSVLYIAWAPLDPSDTTATHASASSSCCASASCRGPTYLDGASSSSMPVLNLVRYGKFSKRSVVKAGNSLQKCLNHTSASGRHKT